MMLIFDFWATFDGKTGVATTRTLNDLGPPNPTKKLAHCLDLLGQPLSRNDDFELYRCEPPPIYENSISKYSQISKNFKGSELNLSGQN